MTTERKAKVRERKQREYKKVEIQLSHPIVAFGQELEVLTLELPERMTLGDMRILDKSEGEVDASIKMISKYGNIPPSSVEEISFEDVEAINEALAPFLETSRSTGRK